MNSPRLIEHGHHQVVEHHVNVLCDLHVHNRHMKRYVDHLHDLAAIVTGYSKRPDAHLFCVGKCIDHILAVPATANTNDEIHVRQLSAKLESEDFFVPDVISDSHNRRHVVIK